MASASQIPKRNLGRQSWSPRPTEATLVMRSEGPMWSSAPTKDGKVPSTTRASGAQRSVCGAVARDGWKLRQRSPQKGSSTPDNPSVGLWPTAPFTQGSLALRGTGGWDGDADCRNQRPKFWSKIWLAVATPQARRPCGPPRNDNRFLSFRGAERRGNPYFFTMDGGSGRCT